MVANGDVLKIENGHQAFGPAFLKFRLVDLGVFHAVDLIGGPLDLNQTIHAGVGDIVTIVVGPDNFVPHDSDAAINCGINGTTGVPSSWWFGWKSTDTSWT